MAGSALSGAAALALFVFALAGGRDTVLLTLLIVPVNLGLGLRGPPGFCRAVEAAHGDDARASALVLLMVLGITAAGTAIVAPFILDGLALLTPAAVLSLSAPICLRLLPPYAARKQDMLP